MSTLRVEGVCFRVYPDDHEPRHVHAERGETVAIVVLLPGGAVTLANRHDRILPANAKRSDVKKILNVAQKHFNVLAALWEQMHQ